MYTVRNIKKLQYEGGIILEFRTIKPFYTVVNTGSFQRAAEVLKLFATDYFDANKTVGTRLRCSVIRTWQNFKTNARR